MDEPTALRIKDELVDAGGEAVRRGMRRPTVPDRLYHFTDCNGLVKILQSRSLWASLATGLSDDSEVRYGVERATAFLLAGEPGGVAPEFLRRIAHFLDPEHTFTKTPIEFDAYIISFCASADRSVHWLHYGRAGTGCAIAFETHGLVHKPFELAPVVYDEVCQNRLIASVVEAVWQCVRKHGIEKPDSNVSRTLFDVAAHSVAAHIWMLAPTLKNLAFANEEEWRLITYDPRHGVTPAGAVPLPVRFRVVGGRVIPYVELPVDPLLVAQIVLGASVPMRLEEPALAILLRETVGGRSVEVVRSTVPVRP